MGLNTRLIRVALAALVLFVLVTAGTFAIVQARDATITSLNPAPTNTPGPPTTRGMMGRGMMQGDFADRMFLTMMIPHHQRAIDMGNDALGNALHPDLKGLAKDIIAVQTAEITEMRAYLAAWYGITT